MARKKNQILPTGGDQPQQISPQLQEVIQQTQVGEPVSLAPPEFISEEIEMQRQQLEADGQMPADISSDQVVGGNLKLQNMTAKYFPEAAMEKLGREDFFPGFRPVQEVGSVSGRIIGKQPIFVRSGGLFPFGIVEARKRALERAAQIKLAARSAILEGGPEGPPQYDRELKSSWFDFVNDWGQKVNWDFTNIKGDPEFMREASSFFTLAKELKFMTKSAKDILDDSMSKENFVPPDNEEFASQVWTGGLKLEDVMANPHKFIEASRSLQSFSNLMNVIRTEGVPLFEDQVSELVSTIPDEAAKIIMRENDYDIIVKTLKDYINPDLIDGWASLLKENFNLFQKQPEIKAALEKVIGNQVKQQLFTTKKFNLSAMSAKKRPTAIPQQPGFFNVKNIKEVEVTEEVEGKKVTTKEFKEELVPLQFIGGFTNFAGTARQPKQVNIIPDVVYNINDDRVERTIGSVNVDIIGSGSLAVDEKGAITFGSGGIPPKDLSQFTIKDFAVIMVNQDTDVTYFDRETGEKVTKKGTEKGGLKKFSTRLVLFDKVEQPLKNAGITKEKGQFSFEAEQEEGGTFNIIFE